MFIYNIALLSSTIFARNHRFHNYINPLCFWENYHNHVPLLPLAIHQLLMVKSPMFGEFFMFRPAMSPPSSNTNIHATRAAADPMVRTGPGVMTNILRKIAAGKMSGFLSEKWWKFVTITSIHCHIIGRSMVRKRFPCSSRKSSKKIGDFSSHVVADLR